MFIPVNLFKLIMCCMYMYDHVKIKHYYYYALVGWHLLTGTFASVGSNGAANVMFKSLFSILHSCYEKIKTLPLYFATPSVIVLFPTIFSKTFFQLTYQTFYLS